MSSWELSRTSGTNRAGLRADLTFPVPHDEFDGNLRTQPGKIAIHDPVFVKIDELAVGRDNLPESPRMIDLGDTALQQTRVCLGVGAYLDLPLLQLAFHRIEGVPDGNPDIVVLIDIARLAVDDKLGPGNAGFDRDLIAVALPYSSAAKAGSVRRYQRRKNANDYNSKELSRVGRRLP